MIMPRNKNLSKQMRAESQEKILATARRLFAKHGYDGCSVSDIARHAGMSKANIYWYFSSKEALFGAILMEGFDTLGTMMAEVAEPSVSGIEKLDNFVRSFIDLMKDQDGDDFITNVFTFIAQGGVERFADFGISTHQIGGGYHQALNTIFEQCQDEGTIGLQIDPDLLSMFFFSFINGLLLMYPDEWKELDYNLIQESIFRLLGANQINN
jgi:AcrR family transcriptional regulator